MSSVLREDSLILNYKDFRVSGVSYDYRKVRPNNIYAAIDVFNHQGKERDGHVFIRKAIRNGAKALILKKRQNINEDVCQIINSNPRKVLERLSAFFYSYPAKKLFTIGVTGTKGKTTTVYLISHLLEDAGIKTGFFSTADFKIGAHSISNYTDKVNETHLTCPEAPELQKSLKRMVELGTKVAIIEATSHALKLCRAAEECQYDVAVITNLQSEHLDFHKSKRDYYLAKAKLFDLLSTSQNKNLEKCAVINNDMQSCQFLKKRVTSKIITYGVRNHADINARSIKIENNRTVFKVGNQTFESSLIGLHNVYNVCAAIAVASHFGISYKKIKNSLARFSGVPGRAQEVKNNRGFRVLIDYAHTPESLEVCLKTLKKNSPKRLIVIFGCAGDRDPKKRAEMGGVATRLADFSIITSEDPRNENPRRIVQEIVRGIKKNNFMVEIDRKKAIQKGLEYAREGDFVVITGKGDEKFLEIRDKQFKWSDEQVVTNYLNQI
ncbi:UDP-N-acetylmuramoyl-L-alanyl-D-glutamate--2,6-diaminopimelate ligase [Patescibacteria group bacterium]|nr:UDP-N-acetylmuramoyl-L-alanyl-D-glutamate--2,6-diaminopimelate ligase [Patescibacteria group bacterium]